MSPPPAVAYQRMTGRRPSRRATSTNPTRANVEAKPWYPAAGRDLAVRARVYRIAFDDWRAVGSGVLDRRPQQRLGEFQAPPFAGDEEAHDRPCGLLVHGLCQP